MSHLTSVTTRQFAIRQSFCGPEGDELWKMFVFLMPLSCIDRDFVPSLADGHESQLGNQSKDFA